LIYCISPRDDGDADIIDIVELCGIYRVFICGICKKFCADLKMIDSAYFIRIIKRVKENSAFYR